MVTDDLSVICTKYQRVDVIFGRSGIKCHISKMDAVIRNGGRVTQISDLSFRDLKKNHL